MVRGGYRMSYYAQKLQDCVAVSHAPEDRATQVLKYRQLGEQVADLKAARKPESVDLERPLAIYAGALQEDRTACWDKASTQEVEESGLASPVWTDDCHSLACTHCQAASTNDLGVPKRLPQVLDLKSIGYDHECPLELPLA